MRPWQGIYTVTGNCQEKQHQIKFWQDPVQTKTSRIFWRDIHNTRIQTQWFKGQGNNRDAQARESERSTDLPKHDTIFKQIFTPNCRTCWTLMRLN